MIRRILHKLTAAAALAAAVAVSVVAAGFALYALLRDPLGPAGAAAVVAAVAALIAWLCAWLAGRKAEPSRREREREQDHGDSALGAGLMDRAADLVRERPLVAGAAALAAGWIFVRNPALTTLLAAVLSGGRDRRH